MNKLLYSKEALLIIAEDRGYHSDRSVAEVIQSQTLLSRDSAKRLLNGTKRWTLEEAAVIGSFFEMTPKEFSEVFLAGLFSVNEDGRWTCHIDEPQKFMKGEGRARKLKRKNSSRAGKRQEELNEILKAIEDIED